MNRTNPVRSPKIKRPPRPEKPPEKPKGPRRFIVGVSGASGAIYARRLIETLSADPRHEIHLIATPAGEWVIRDELKPVRARLGANQLPGSGRRNLIPYLDLSPEHIGRIVVHPAADIGAGPASGTFRAEAMIVVPCSMNTLAAIAHGISDNLLTRSAAVTLKEGRTLILVPRETPLTLIDLRNMEAVAEAGGVILPASPGFYHHPQGMEDLIRFVVQKILDRLDVDVPNPIRWE